MAVRLLDDEVAAPPSDFDAEQAALGCCMFEPDAAGIVFSVVDPDDFYRTYHRLIATAIKACLTRREPVDIVTVIAELRARGHLDEAGGGEYVTRLVQEVPTASHARRYAGIVAEKALLRQGIRACDEIRQEAFQQPNIQAFLNRAAERFLRITEARLSGQARLQTWNETAEATTELARTATAGVQALSPARLGIAGLDELIGPLGHHRIVVVKGKRGHGKTHIAVNAMMSTARELITHQQEGHVVVFSFESSGMYKTRGLAWHTGIDSFRIKRGFDKDKYPEQAAALWQAATDFSFWPVAMFEGVADEDAVESHIRLFSRKHRIALVIIDFWQAMPRRSGRTSVEEYEMVANRFRDLSNEVACPFLITSQVSTNQATGEVIAKNSTAIEDIATMAIRLQRDPKDKHKYTLICDKQREGFEFDDEELYVDKLHSRVMTMEEANRLSQYDGEARSWPNN